MDEFQQELAKATVENTVGVAYNDIVSPSAKPIGTVISLLPRTIRLFFSRWEKWVVNAERSLELTAEAIQEKVAQIPEEKLSEPEPAIAVPALQQLSYCYDSQELREMYANLLVSSMNVDTKYEVHPAYVDIIKQLTPDEAKLLKRIFQIKDDCPLISVRRYNADNSYNEVIRNFSTIAFDACEKPLNIYAYLDNLERLKLIDIPYGGYITDNQIYKPLINHEIIQKIMSEKLPEKCSWDIEKKYFYLTAFGKNFVEICLK